MSKKGYTKVEREQVGRDLLTVGLEMLSQRGLKGTTLQDILQAVGISKPFFTAIITLPWPSWSSISSTMKFHFCSGKYGTLWEIRG